MKKGFTLVEMLGVIVIISIVVVITYPSITGLLNDSKKTSHEFQIDTILDATYDYTLENLNLLPDENNTTYITLNELIKYGYIEGELNNPIENGNFSNDLVISIKNTEYKNNNDKYYKYKGGYEYKVLYEKMKDESYITNKPTINIEGFSINENSKQIDLNNTYNLPEFTATSKIDSQDISSKVILNIMKDGKNIDKITTNKAGIYKIIYTVVDNHGYSNARTISIIITDILKTTLIIPENITIDTSIHKLDLMGGASCTDNSGTCDIKIKENIKYGEKGKYIVEYIATDPSGNTETDNRVITIS